MTLFNASTVGAQQRCSLPGEVDALIIGLQLSLSTEGALTSLQRARLTGLGRAIDKTGIERALRSADLRVSQNAISAVIASAQTITAAGFIANRGRLEQQLKEALSLVRSLCAERASRIEQQLARRGVVRQLEQHARLQRLPSSSLRTPDNGSVYYLFLLVPLILGVTSVIILTLRAYEWILTFAFSRRACFISAAVEHDLDIIDGHILIIGRRGVRFQPVNEGSHNRLEELGEGVNMNLIIGHHCLPGRIDALRGGHAAIFFDEPIDRDLIDMFLRSSTIKPRYVRAPPPKRMKTPEEKKRRKTLPLTSA